MIAPWREWDLSSRTKLLEFAAKNKIPIMKHNKKESPYSVDANILHRSAEGKILEDPWKRPPENVFGISKSFLKYQKHFQVVFSTDLQVSFLQQIDEEYLHQRYKGTPFYCVS